MFVNRQRHFTKCFLCVTVCDRMGDTGVMFKCAKVVRLRAANARQVFPVSEHVCVVNRKILRHLASVRLTYALDTLNVQSKYHI